MESNLSTNTIIIEYILAAIVHIKLYNVSKKTLFTTLFITYIHIIAPILFINKTNLY